MLYVFKLMLLVMNVPVNVISVIGDNLCAAVGKSNTVFSLNNSVLVLSLFLVEVGAGVVVRDTVGVGEGTRRDLDLSVDWWGCSVWGWNGNAGRQGEG